jgi:WD40 repeat protein
MSNGPPQDDAKRRWWSRPRLPWIVLHFAFVASLAVVYVRRESWVLKYGDAAEQIRLVIHMFIRDRPLSPDGRRVFVLGRQGVLVWDVARWKRVCVLEKGPHAGAFSPDGERYAGICFGGAAFVWDATTGARLCELRGHEGPITDFSFSPDARRVLSVSDGKLRIRRSVGDYTYGDGTVRIWDAKTGDQLHRLGQKDEPFLTAAFAPDGECILTHNEKHVFLWDAKSYQKAAQLKGHTSWISDAGFSASGDRVVTASDDNTARVWDARTGECLHVLEGHEGCVNYARFSANDTLIQTYSLDSTMRAWNAETGEETVVFREYLGGALPQYFLPDCTRVVVDAGDGTDVGDARSGELLAVLPSGQFASYPLFPAEEELLISTSEGLQLWRRRRPEWWWGHFYRPEVWVAFVLGLIWLGSVVKYLRRRLRPV